MARVVKRLDRMTLGGMRWRHPLFVHWLVPPDTLAPRLPRGVTLDLWRGHGVVTLAAIAVEGPMPRALLNTAMAQLFGYLQLNLRTYVVGSDGPGMTLLHTRVDRWSWALGARLAGMPYQLDRALAFEVRSASLSLRARAIAVEGLVAADAAPEAAAPGTLEHFALERYRAYAALPVGRTLCVAVRHEPWRARTVRLDRPLAPPELLLDVQPESAQLCDDVDVVVEHAALEHERATP